MSLPNEGDMSSSSDTQVFIHLHSKEHPLFLLFILVLWFLTQKKVMDFEVLFWVCMRMAW